MNSERTLRQRWRGLLTLWLLVLVRSPSSSGLGHRPFKAAARVRTPVGDASGSNLLWPGPDTASRTKAKLVMLRRSSHPLELILGPRVG